MIPVENIEDLYELSLTQQGILFHVLEAPELGQYFMQSGRMVRGLNMEAFRRAWERVVERHPVLRTSFHWGGLDKPIQVVHRKVTIPYTEFDYRDIEPEEQQRLLREYRRENRKRGFNLDEAPLLRIAFFRFTDDDYYFIWSRHHILLDGWSGPLLSREMLAYYQAFRQGNDLDLPQPRPYRDYIAWLQRQDIGKAEMFWRNYLKGFTTPTPVPLDGLGVARPGHSPRPQSQKLDLSPELSTQLKDLARGGRFTMSLLIQAGWALLLSRYAGQDDVAMGTAFSGRPPDLPGAENIIGLFVNALPLRFVIPPDREVLDWLVDLQARYAELTQYDYTPLAQVQRWSEVPPGTRLCNVAYVFENYPQDPSEGKDRSGGGGGKNAGSRGKGQSPGGESASPNFAELNESHSALALYVHISPDDRIFLNLVYAPDRIAGDDAARMLQQLQAILTSFADNPTQRLSHVSLLPPIERQRIVQDWNSTGAEYPADVCMHQVFEKQAAHAPEATALTFSGQHVSYRQLNERANQLAQRLQKLGVGPEVRVGLCLERSLDAIVGLVAIFKAGGVYVPLDPAYPRDRLTFMLNDAGIEVLLTRTSILAGLPEVPASVRIVDSQDGSLASESAASCNSGVTPSNLAYVIYTSGSTGQPKGVMLEHRGLVNLINAQIQMYDVRPDSRILQFASLGFDASVAEIWRALASGASLCMAEPQALLPGPDLVQLLTNEKVTHATLPPSVLSLLPDAPLPMLRTVIVGGDTCPAELVSRWAPGRRFFNGYGPTEATVCTTVARCIPDEVKPSIGRPIANMQAYVLDNHLQLMPVGLPGELYLGGDGLARGYGNRPGLTAERFLPHPFSKVSGARLYRTGDQARWLADGNLEFLGRIDNQVKIRGFRIELGEIEAKLRQHPAVIDAAVLAREDAPGEKRLVAYVVARAAPDEVAAKLLADWQALYEQIPQLGEAADPLRYFFGFNSSYTGLPIDLEEMEEWAGHAAERILQYRPRQVLEIGCGTGAILFRVAPACERYVGIDFSKAALEYVSRHMGQLPAIELLHRQANELGDFDKESFDCVILNSVVQFFPSAEYLQQVIEAAQQLVRPGGILFIGDVRNRKLLEAFHVSLQMSQAAATLPSVQLIQRAAHRIDLERELSIDPTLFAEIPLRYARVGQVHVLLKQGRAKNELTRFRYDVVLHIGHKPAEVETVWLEWAEPLSTLDDLRILLEEGQPASLGVRSIPNARVAADVRVTQLAHLGVHTVGQLRQATMESDLGIEPQDLIEMGRQLGYQVEFSWAGGDEEGRFDAIFWQSGTERPNFPDAAVQTRDWSVLVSSPSAVTASSQRLPELRAHLASRLPEYMIPSVFMFLPAMPLTPNGKIDRKRLPVPEGRPEVESTYAPPGTPTEEAVAKAWAKVLKVERVGIHDNFFTLGGHSLLVTQVVSHLRELLQVELPLRSVFEAPTVAALAERVDALLREKAKPQAPPVVRVPRDQPLPLSFAQQRLWFIDQLTPGVVMYNVPGRLRLRGQLDVEALELALTEMLERHEVLRTRFPSIDNEPVQHIDPPTPVKLSKSDLSSLPTQARQSEVRQIMARLSRASFDLANGPLLRFHLAQLHDEEAVLLFTMHHGITDGWSAGIFTREVTALYEAFRAGRPSPLVELPVQYADYAVWQRSWLQGDVLQQQLDYWKEQLREIATLELPTDHPRPAVQSLRSTSYRFQISSELTERLHELSRQEGTTLFMTLLAALQTLLARYTGQTDVAVGSPIAGRTRSELEGLIGFFINTLVFRGDLSGDPTFLESLRRVREACLGAYAHQDVPFEKLIEELQPERDLSRHPIFQVVLVLQNFQDTNQPASRTAPGKSGQTGNEGFTELDLSLFLAETAHGLGGILRYSTDLFEEATIARLVGHFQILLEQVVARPKEKLSRLQIFSEAEKRQLLVDWNSTQSEYPSTLVHSLFEEQAAHRPQAVAVRYRDRQWTYCELDQRASKLASRLRHLGVRPEVPVGVCLERSPSWIIALLSVFKAGGSYLPLDPGYPRDRLNFILADAGARLILSQRSCLDRLDPGNIPVIYVDDPDQDSELAAPAHIEADQLAYVIYTSGSTGKPKGVLVQHRGLSNLIAAQVKAYGVGAESRIAQFASLSFDASIAEVWRALTSGACLCIIPDEIRADGEALVQFLHHHEVTHATLPPSLLAALPNKTLTNLTALIVGGEACPAEVVSRWAPGRRFFNAYGPSETTVAATFALYRPDGSKPSIGRPIANTTAYVLDRHLFLVPVGVPGELHLGGAGLARGYLGRADLTADRFIPDPFGDRPGGRLYRTGDLCRWLSDGNLEFLGRIDEQVKIRGFRIELGEIESVLAEHPAIQQSVVMAREDSPGDKKLVAYVVAGGGSINEFRSHLSSRLPEYMIPAAWVVLNALPLTASGKVDRKALPAPETKAEAESNYVAPGNPTEEIIAGVWARLLKMDRVGIHDNFFLLGGHSLLVTQVVSHLREALEVELPLRSIFEAPTIAGLAARVEALRRQESGLLAPPLVPVPRDQPLALSFAQQRLWFIDQLTPGLALYSVPGRVRLRGTLVLTELQRAINEMWRRHEVLRTRFPSVEGQPIQLIDPPAPFELAVTDLRELATDQRQTEVRKLFAELNRKPFDLAKGPLARLHLVQLRDEEAMLLHTMHHSITDGWSTTVFNRELSALYEAFRDGKPSPLHDLPIQYADFAVWQRNWLQNEVLERQIAYWKNQLRGLSPLEMPTDRPRPVVQTFRSASYRFTLSADLTENLQELAKKEQATLFMVLLASLQTLLGRYSGQMDVAVGSPIAGRTRKELEGLIGYFINTLVFRGDLSGDPTFAELLKRERESCLEAYAHQDLPFEKLIEELQPARDLSRHPLFQIMLVLQNFDASTNTGRKQTATGKQAGSATAEGLADQFDMSLFLTETMQGMQCVLRYSSDLFDAETIARFVGHLQILLEQVVEHPTSRLSKLAILPDDEKKQLLVDWNATQNAYPSAKLAHQLFEEQVERTPDAVAIVVKDQSLTYRELNKRANQVAGYLQSQGVAATSVVGICAERRPEMLAGLLGILKAGGVYLPLDPSFPRDRLAFMLHDAKAAVVLVQESTREYLPQQAATYLSIEKILEDASSEAFNNPKSRITPEHLAYLIYTSGSTGLPKGVEIPHRALVNFLDTMKHRPGLRPSDVLLAVTTLSFDIAALELFLPLTVGATIHLVDRDTASDGALLTQALRDSKATVLQATPATWRMLIEAGWSGAADLRILCGGEALPADLAQQLLDRSAELWNVYGPTETTVWSSVNRLQTGFTSVSIGQPIGNTQMYVLDRYFNPTPIGVPGELYIGGLGVAQGYRSRPALTAERFVPDPFATSPGQRMYRTGDLARWLPSGDLECLGRIDHQVKIRGFRIELGEIETALREHPSIRESVVVARDDAAGGSKLVAYLTSNTAASPDITELRNYLKSRLPDYMVPSVFVQLESLPLTPNGKVDRKALPAPEQGRLQTAGDYIGPRNPTEAKLANIWASVLKMDRVGIDDNFFELGGHSLLVTQVSSRLREALQVELPLRTIFEAPTVAALAERVELLQLEQTQAQAPPLVAIPRDQPMPLSFAQQRLWFIDQLTPGVTIYNLPGRVRLTGMLDKPALERALAELLRRHESLRSRFAVHEGQPIQVIDPPQAVEVVDNDLRALTPSERQAEVRQLMARQRKTPFDLAAGPLARWLLVRLRDDEAALLYTLHHSISDGWSMTIFSRELTALYEAFRDAKPADLPDLPVQYADYASWQRSWLQGEVLERQLGYWKEHLQGLPALELPGDRARPAVQTFRSASHGFALPQDLTQKLNDLSRKQGVTLFMTLLAGLQTVLSRYSGQVDIAVGSPIAGRTRKELEGLIGFFINTLVFRSDLSGDPTFRDLLGRVRETCLGAYAHQDLPFEKLVEEIQPERDLSRHPVFQVVLVFQNFQAASQNPANPNARSAGNRPDVADNEGLAELDMSLFVSETSDGLRGVLRYSTDLFDAATIERFLSHLHNLFEDVASDPSSRLSRLRILSVAEEKQVLVDWNSTRTDYRSDQFVHRLFEHQAASEANAPAIVYRDHHWTYGELDRRASQLARQLSQMGISPEVVVAVCMERSPEWVKALLAVFKAGGVYLPLDPGYPKERLSYMIADAQVGLILTERSCLDKLDTENIRVLCLDDPAQLQLSHAGSDASTQSDASQLAYVIYTSGSTGKPKGVQVQHCSLSNLIAAQVRAYEVNSRSRVAQFASLSFDASIAEVWRALTTGACLCLIPDEIRADGEALVRFLETQHLSHATLPPSLLATLPANPLLELATLIVGGEACPAEVVSRWAPGRRFFNAYGPSETTVAATFARCQPDGRKPNIGQPIANTTAYVLDRYLRPVPVGVPGELFLGGAGLARGYLGRPDLTAERFIPDPFGDRRGARLYRTGDLCRWLPEGNLDFLGRIDEQVKIRGFRIELGEIESVLTSHPTVQQGVVVARQDAPSQNRLVAYLVGRDGIEISIGQIRSHLSSHLPEYMLPSAWVVLQALPLTVNGKVDRKALPAPEANAESESTYQAPTNPTEEIIAGVWAKVLKLDRVGIHDNFFALGGHSLLVTQVVSHVRAALDVELPLRTLFESPTVAGLAQRMESLKGDQLGSQAPPLVAVRRDQPLALSFAQQRLWFIDQLTPGTAMYNVPGRLRLRGAIDRPNLERAIGELVRRHEVLRTRFSTHAGEPIQQIDPPGEVHLTVTDFRSFAGEERQKEVNQFIVRETRTSFNLATGPLIRFRLLLLRDDESLLLHTMHHTITDGWSMDIFARELTALYEAFRAGKPSPLGELPVQYADYAAWQRAWLQGEVLHRQIDYWKEKLKYLSPLEMPGDRARPAVQTFRSVACNFALPLALSQQLNELSRKHGVTLFMTLLAGFQTLLARYSGQNDIAIGSPIAGRTRKELEGLIGFFINTLVFRGDLSGDPTFQELLGRVRETCLGAYAHQDLPFEKLVEEIQPKRDLSRHPIFQVVLALQNYQNPNATYNPPSGRAASGNQNQSDKNRGEGLAELDMSLFVNETAEGLRGVLRYSTDLFDESTVVRLLSHLRKVFEEMVANPGQRVSRLQILSEVERRQLLVEWNSARADFPIDRPVHERLEDRARVLADRVAVEGEREKLTYRELDQRANQLTNYLRQLGVGREVLVAVCMDRTPTWLVAQLAIFKAGGAYLPLDPSYPRDRLGYMIADGHALLILTQRSFLDRLDVSGVPSICLDEPEQIRTLAALPVEALSVERDPADLAYAIYTSGSTGKPKGVLIQQRSLSNLIAAQIDAYGVNSNSRVAQFASIGFDASIAEVWRSLISGACLCLVPSETRADGEGLAQFLHHRKITHATLPPSVLATLPHRPLPDLATLIVGGEVCSTELVTRWAPGRRFFNGYGPSETTVCSAFALCQPDGRKPTIGRALANTTAYVVDQQLRLAPIGVPGELCIGGIGVGRGYLGRPGLTAERFIPDPFGNQPGARMYRTGDLCRWLPEGELEFLGRIDEQVKIRGFRIELGEIETVLVEHPSVHQALVMAREDQPGQKRIVAYVVATEGSETQVSQYRSYLSEHLPEYMIPSAWVMLNSLPLTVNGKVDRKALPVPDGAAVELDSTYAAPANPTEEIIAGIWASVLKVERVGTHDDFFVLGGHSLLVTQVVSRVREALEVDLPLRSLFEAPTVAGLARRIEELRSELSGAQIAPLVRYSRDQALPLSFAQQRLWFVDQLTPGMALYNVPGRLRLSGSLDQSALQRALDEMWRRHEILRTRFPAVDGQPIQHIDPAAPVDWSLIDLRDSAPEARQAEVRRLFAEQARSSFDLAAGPLARVLLILLRDDEALMIHTMHHTITDGWSVDIFSRELRALYAAFRDDRESPLHDLPIQYGDFAIWQRSWLQGEVLERQVNYWRNQLRGLATLELPTDRPRPPVQAFNGASYNFALPLELTSQLRELSRQQGVTLFMTLLAGFKTLLGRYSGQDDIVIGAPIAGRNRRELEGLIGFFVNTLVLRCNLSGDPSFVQLVQRVREVCLGAYAHQDLPFDKLVDEIQPRRDPSRNPLFQVVFGLQNMPQSRELPQGSPKRPGNEKAPNQNTLSGNGTSKFDLGLQCFESPQGLRCVIGYNTDLFDSATITRFAVHYHALLRDIVADPHRSLWAFSLVDSSSAVSMQPGQSPEQSATVDESTDLLSTQLDQLSDEELAALLEKTLAEREKES